MPLRVPRVQVVPHPDEQVSFQVEGRERLRWHSGRRYPRPFFFPVVGLSGRSVTRMGHPAAPDHDHHRSLWWGHQSVGGVNFWEERGGAQQIRQDEWVHYQDGDDEAGMAVRLGWYDAHKSQLLKQELIAVLRPLPHGELALELQTTFTPAVDGLPLDRTNFGFLGLRVAASLSVHYGGGKLTNSEGAVGEQAAFGKPARWMDYSGPVAGESWDEGVTWFDHPDNPRYPTAWHVRDDGWMSAAFCLREGLTLRKDQPLLLRYAFYVHNGLVNHEAVDVRHQDYAKSKAYELVRAERPWRVRLSRAGG